MGKRLIDAEWLLEEFAIETYIHRHGEMWHITGIEAVIGNAPAVDAVEVSRLGKLGQLMMQYNGCPRGAIGTRGGDGTTVKIIELEAITDVDGNRWVPVLAEDLEFLKSSAETAHGRWIDNHCSECGEQPIGNDAWETLGIDPPKYERFMYYCPCCGAKMKAGDQHE